jgi:ATP-dependent helicase/nuclease subunit A
MSDLVVVKASAGSGKTFRLAYEYVKLVIENPQAFRHILAVTFTNMATAEMKERVIKELYLLSAELPSNYLEKLCAELKFAKERVQQRASHALNFILHNYSRFTIETIDSFFQRVVRSFSKELGLNSGLQIELNTSLILEAAVDSMLESVESDKNLQKWLIDFVQQKLDSGKSWNVRKEITSLGKEIYKEVFQVHKKQITHKVSDRDFLNAYRDKLIAICRQHEIVIQSEAAKAYDAISAKGYSISDFKYAKTSFARNIFDLREGKKNEPNNRTIEVLNDTTNACTKTNKRYEEIVEFTEQELLPHLSAIVQQHQNNSTNYNTAQLILENLYTLGLLTDLQHYADKYTSQEDLFPISDTGMFLNTIIGENDTPFVYERVGNYYHHYMIDEFQDTSVIQYNNFKPLLSESLSANHKNLVVGDVKQAIYRFRNTNWEVLANKVKSEFGPFVKEDTLQENWRSEYEVVQFNNSMFRKLPLLLSQELNTQLQSSILQNDQKDYFLSILPSLYAGVEQQCQKKEKHGYVQVNVHHASNSELHYEKLMQQIFQLQDAGYNASDIAVLARTNTEAREIVQFVIEYQSTNNTTYNLQITSSEALLLNFSKSVNQLVKTIRYIIQPNENLNAFELWKLMNAANKGNTNDKTLVATDFQFELKKTVGKTAESLSNKSLYELCSGLIDAFGLLDDSNEWPYIYAFLDILLEYQNRYGSDLQRFLNYWENEGDKKTVPPSENQDAIQVITVHKSKGLEFKAVLIPFCDWKFDHNSTQSNIVWCETKQAPFSSLDLIPINYKSQMAFSHFSYHYFNEKLKAFVDNLNLLYVALTRAKEVLYIQLEAGNKSVRTVGHLLQQALRITTDSESANPNDDVNECYEFGSLQAISSSDRDTKIKPFFIASKPDKISTNKLHQVLSAKELFLERLHENEKLRKHGSLLHEVFSVIVSMNDVSHALEEALLEGKISREEKAYLQKAIEKKVNKSDLLQEWYSNKATILNEQDILLPGSKKIRPDRIMNFPDKVVILDYKFGTTKSDHDIEQVKQYMQVLKQMFNKEVEGYLWYFYLNEIVTVDMPETNNNEQLSLW